MLRNRSFRSWAVAVTAFLTLTVAFPVSVRADPNIYAKTLVKRHLFLPFNDNQISRSS
jgi:hypothetical protein